MPGGPVGPLSGWAATSNVEVGQTVYPADRATGGRGGKEGVERGKGPLAREGVLYLDICAALPPSSYSYAVADGAELPIYPGQI